MNKDASLLYRAYAQLGEGAIWNYENNNLYWVDIESKCFHIFDPVSNENKSFFCGKRIGTVVPVHSNSVLLALEDGLGILDLTTWEFNYKNRTDIHLENMRFNDGKCDPQGRFWVGTLSLDNIPEVAKLFSVSNDFTLSEKINGLTISNGLAWALDGSAMYHIDTPASEISKYDFDKVTGDISNRQVIIKVPIEMGYPDGMTIDNEGMLWIAMWDGFCVARYDPNNGKLLQKVNVPAPKVTSCAFGGADLSQLFITTARCDLSEEELERYPLSGSLFIADLDIKGLPAFHFNLC